MSRRHDLAGKEQPPRRSERPGAAVALLQPGLAASGALRQRHERRHARVLHPVHGAADRRRCGAARQGRAALSAVRQAHAAGQRDVARDPDARQRRPGDRADRGHHVARGALRGRHGARGGRDRLRHRLPRQPFPVADGHRRARRPHAARALGRGAARLPRHHGAGLSEPVLSLRARHQPGARRQHHLSRRMPGALRHGLPRGAARWWLLGHGLPPGRARRVCRAFRRPPRDPGVVAPGHEQLVQERQRPRPDHVALAAGRLLAVDEGAGARRLRAALAPPGDRLERSA